jgi:hypothetical protein
LCRARRLSEKLQIGGLKTQGVAIGLGPIPSLELKLA